MSRNELRLLKTKSLMEIGKENLIDINTVTIDVSKSKEDRIEKYIQDVKNPYFFRVGDTPVQICYQNGNVSLQDSIINAFSNG